jgi:hypothetical protein
MKYHRKIAFFFLFSWLIAAPLPLLAQQEKKMGLGALMCLTGEVYSLICASACLFAGISVLATDKLPFPDSTPIPQKDIVPQSATLFATSAVLFGISEAFFRLPGLKK